MLIAMTKVIALILKLKPHTDIGLDINDAMIGHFLGHVTRDV